MPRPALPPDLSKQMNIHVATPCGAALSSCPNVTEDLANLLWLVMGSYQPFNLNRIRSGQKLQLLTVTPDSDYFRPASATKSAKQINNYPWSYPSSETLQQTSVHKHCRKLISIHTTTIAFLRLDLPVHVEVIYTSDLGSKKTRRSVLSSNHAPLRITCACNDAPQPSLFPQMYHRRANTALFSRRKRALLRAFKERSNCKLKGRRTMRDRITSKKFVNCHACLRTGLRPHQN
ncbi:hypothetical protein NC651_005459 [Populus alba x Populus x berolinensis]|nr:hypothetical protein NC651_005459 [Populus alba x Populus x berolinensis]